MRSRPDCREIRTSLEILVTRVDGKLPHINDESTMEQFVLPHGIKDTFDT